MDNINNVGQNFNNTARGLLSFLDNQYVSAILIIFLIVYAAHTAPRLPPYILRIFDNIWFQLLVFFLIAYMANKNPAVAIIAAIALMVTIFALNRLKINESFAAMLMDNREGMLNVMKDNMSLMDMKNKMENHMTQPTDHDTYPYADQKTAMEEIPENSMHDIGKEMKNAPREGQLGVDCTYETSYKNNFYPQYVNMKPDAYLARYTGNEVDGYDPNAFYASN